MLTSLNALRNFNAFRGVYGVWEMALFLKAEKLLGVETGLIPPIDRVFEGILP